MLVWLVRVERQVAPLLFTLARMASPQSRRRGRSGRVTGAVLALAAAAAFVGTAIGWGTPLTIAASATCAVLLGVLATFLVYDELRISRVATNRERAQVAADYRDLAAVRSSEEESFRETMVEKLGARQAEVAQLRSSLAELEEALASAQRRAAEAARKHMVERRRAEAAEAAGLSTSARLEESEQRAAAAMVRVAEIEAELDTLRVELDAAQAELLAWENSRPVRKHA